MLELTENEKVQIALMLSRDNEKRRLEEKQRVEDARFQVAIKRSMQDQATRGQEAETDAEKKSIFKKKFDILREDAVKIQETLNKNILEIEKNAVAKIIEKGFNRKEIHANNNDCLYYAATHVARLSLYEDTEDENTCMLLLKCDFMAWIVKEGESEVSDLYKHLSEQGDDAKDEELYSAAHTGGETDLKPENITPEGLHALKVRLLNHITDNRFASSFEVTLMGKFLRSRILGRRIMISTATHALQKISEWDIGILNVGGHYEVFTRETRPGGGSSSTQSTKSMEYRELQRTAKMLGVKQLTRPAPVLKRAIAYKKGLGRKKKGGGDCQTGSCQACMGEYYTLAARPDNIFVSS